MSKYVHICWLSDLNDAKDSPRKRENHNVICKWNNYVVVFKLCLTHRLIVINPMVNNPLIRPIQNEYSNVVFDIKHFISLCGGLIVGSMTKYTVYTE